MYHTIEVWKSECQIHSSSFYFWLKNDIGLLKTRNQPTLHEEKNKTISQSDNEIIKLQSKYVKTIYLSWKREKKMWFREEKNYPKPSSRKWKWKLR